MNTFETALESLNVTRVSSPYADEKGLLKVDFHDPMLAEFEVTVMADTGNVDNDGGRLTTLVARFPRSILSEVNTHRVFSRNSASSRARSVRSTVDDVMTKPYIPVFTRNQRGMSGTVIYDEQVIVNARRDWLRARDSAVAGLFRLLLGNHIESLSDHDIIADRENLMDFYYSEVYNNDESLLPSIHKQDSNRLLEPFMWHEAVVSATEWKNFVELRVEYAAHPAIIALGVLVKAALEVSIPVRSWVHMPFVPQDQIPVNPVAFASVRDLSMQSSTEAARVSFKDVADRKPVETTSLGEKLLASRHLSPFEHVAFTDDGYDEMYALSDGAIPDPVAHDLSGNYDVNWVQLRQVLTVGSIIS